MSWSKENKCLPGGVLLSNHNDLNSYTNLSLYSSLNTVHIMATYLVFWFSTQLQTSSSVSVLHICFCPLLSHHLRPITSRSWNYTVPNLYPIFISFCLLAFWVLWVFWFVFWGEQSINASLLSIRLLLWHW